MNFTEIRKFLLLTVYRMRQWNACSWQRMSMKSKLVTPRYYKKKFFLRQMKSSMTHKHRQNHSAGSNKPTRSNHLTIIKCDNSKYRQMSSMDCFIHCPRKCNDSYLANGSAFSHNLKHLLTILTVILFLIVYSTEIKRNVLGIPRLRIF